EAVPGRRGPIGPTDETGVAVLQRHFGVDHMALKLERDRLEAETDLPLFARRCLCDADFLMIDDQIKLSCQAAFDVASDLFGLTLTARQDMYLRWIARVTHHAGR